jgi:hypothetical protein
MDIASEVSPDRDTKRRMKRLKILYFAFDIILYIIKKAIIIKKNKVIKFPVFFKLNSESKMF